jgi:hypothetical protein
LPESKKENVFEVLLCSIVEGQNAAMRKALPDLGQFEANGNVSRGGLSLSTVPHAEQGGHSRSNIRANAGIDEAERWKEDAPPVGALPLAQD